MFHKIYETVKVILLLVVTHLKFTKLLTYYPFISHYSITNQVSMSLIIVVTELCEGKYHTQQCMEELNFKKFNDTFLSQQSHHQQSSVV